VFDKTMRQAISEGAIQKNIGIDTAIDLLYGSLYYRLLLGVDRSMCNLSRRRTNSF
jgi:hypothetical protein